MPPYHHRLYAATPVNKTAAMQLAGGVHFEPEKRKNNARVDQPDMIDERPFAKNPGFKNMMGKRFDRLTVIGLFTNGKSWVCKCLCGRYCLQRSGTLEKNRTNGDPHRCQECDYTAWLRDTSKHGSVRK